MSEESGALHQQSPLGSRLYNGLAIYAVQGLSAPVRWYQGWNEWFWPPGDAANIVKTYNKPPYLPISIFFPKDYDQTSPENLPLIFTIHGGGFCIGQPEDDRKWNRRFADEHKFLVVALNYRKAPWYPFPTATHDLESLMLAVMEDESLPIDKTRVAVAGFSAGGNLTLSVCQLPSIRQKVKPSAAIPIYSSANQTIPVGERAKRRHYKPDLGPGARGSPTDMLASVSPIFQWSYINPGQNLRDPLLSPHFAARDTLPKNIFVIGAELDQLAHEDWALASKLAGRPEPSVDDKVGQEQPAATPGELILDNDRYAFEYTSPSGENGRWLLIPDQLHGFDHLPQRWFGDEESLKDALVKTEKYQKVLGDWLHQVVWKEPASASH